jgi:hypothetical protein
MFKKLSSLHNERSFRDQDFADTLLLLSLKQCTAAWNAEVFWERSVIIKSPIAMDSWNEAC